MLGEYCPIDTSNAEGRFASLVLCPNPPLPGLPDHALPVLNHDRTDHNTNGALVRMHSNSSVIQSLLYDYAGI